MRKIFIVLTLCISICGYTQQIEEEMLNDQQLEDIAEADETATDDEFNMQQLATLKNNPVNINDPDFSPGEIPLLPPILADNLISYRNLMGRFISIYELQAVPGFTLDIIRKILPYITVSDNTPALVNFRKRFSDGQYNFLSRPTYPDKIYLRYKYQYRNLLQYGAVIEKDAGEKSFIDFYSVHLFARNIGKIKSLAVGDYTLNIGQGLIHWQSQAFRKTSSVINIKRQADIIRPYNSAGEYNFQRGIAITFKKSKWEPTVFFSYRKLSANISNDSIYKDVITSINTSGLHVTENEIKNRNNISLVSYGGSLKYISGQGSAAVNILSYNYSLPLLKRNDPYNLYALKGNSLTNGSIDYNYTHNNIHLFGELAISANGARAMVNGMMTSVHSTIDIAVLYRKADKDYQSIYANAFTENTTPSNEEGIYLGVSIRPFQRWKIDAYSDFFRFPWLKYRVDAPTIGSQYLVQLTWKPDKKIEVYTRLRYRQKPLNTSGSMINYPEDQMQQNWRTHISFQVSRSVLLRNRVEVCRYAKGIIALPENGYLFYADLVYQPLGKPFSGNLRFQVFDCDSYATRLYAYENDVMYASTTPAFFNKGTRVYCNGRIKLRTLIMPKLNADLGFKASLTIYGPGLEPAQNPISEIRLQLLLSPGK